jgi:3-hydroxyisobutyrate dehydrogenase-like beta-hydroxyacid dehydrogenase
MSSIRVGQIGLGNLGFLMARSVAAKGFSFTVCDLRPEPIKEMVKLGAKAVGTPREVAANSDVVISIVNDIADNEAIIFGKDGLMDGIKKGSVIMVCSTVGPDYVKTVYSRCNEKGVRVVDVGMSKDGPGEEIGSQTMMCGGDEADYNYCKPVLDAIARHVFYVGPMGAGQAFKVINNLMGIAIGSVTREALNVGVKAGLDLQKMVEVMKVSTGGSWSLNYMDFQMKAKKGVATSVSRPAPTKNIGLKDWTLAKEFAKAVGAEIPATEFIYSLDTRSMYKALAEAQQKI